MWINAWNTAIGAIQIQALRLCIPCRSVIRGASYKNRYSTDYTRRGLPNYKKCIKYAFESARGAYTRSARVCSPRLRTHNTCIYKRRMCMRCHVRQRAASSREEFLVEVGHWNAQGKTCLTLAALCLSVEGAHTWIHTHHLEAWIGQLFIYITTAASKWGSIFLLEKLLSCLASGNYKHTRYKSGTLESERDDCSDL
jgi:hypothetical protein